MRIRQPFSLWSEVVDLVYPPRCEVCGADCRTALCADCARDVVPILLPYCRRCNVPFPEGSDDRVLCGECQTTQSRLAAVRSAGLHTGRLREAVLRMKFGGARRLVPALASLVYDRVLREADEEGGLPLHEVGAIVPASLHPRRRRWRGFDQANLLAAHLGRLWDLPAVQALDRVKHTTPQVDLDYGERRANLRGAFRPSGQGDVAGLTVVVVDDVFTTGATLEACAAALRKAGAARVYGLTITRAVPPWHKAAAEATVRGY